MAIKIDTQKEIIFGSSNPNVSRILSAKEKNEDLWKIAPHIYTTNLIDKPENIVRRNLIGILAYRIPTPSSATGISMHQWKHIIR